MNITVWITGAASDSSRRRCDLAGFLMILAAGFDRQQLRAIRRLGALAEIVEQTFIRQIELVGIVPVLLRRLVEPLHDVMRIRFDCELPSSVETPGRQIDGADDGTLRRPPGSFSRAT